MEHSSQFSAKKLANAANRTTWEDRQICQLRRTRQFPCAASFVWKLTAKSKHDYFLSYCREGTPKGIIINSGDKTGMNKVHGHSISAIDGGEWWPLWEAWSLTLRKEQTLRAFESRVLLKIFGSNRDDITGE